MLSTVTWFCSLAVVLSQLTPQVCNRDLVEDIFVKKKFNIERGPGRVFQKCREMHLSAGETENDHLGPKGMDILKTALNANPKISKVNLYGNKMGHEGVLHVADVLKNHRYKLRDVNLAKKSIRKCGCSTFG